MFLEYFVFFSHKENSSCLGCILFWLKTCFTSEINFFLAMPFWMENHFSSPKPPSEWKMKTLLRNRFLKVVTIFLRKLISDCECCDFPGISQISSFWRNHEKYHLDKGSWNYVNKHKQEADAIQSGKRRLLDICRSRKIKRVQLMENLFF